MSRYPTYKSVEPKSEIVNPNNEGFVPKGRMCLRNAHARITF